MKILLSTLIIILLYLFLIKPNTSRKDKMKPYEQTLICHRGFFNNIDIPENSIKAFKKAVDHNYGIELDVQITTDNKLVVFHDESLKRMTGIDKNLRECDYKELQKYNLLDTNEKIPLFSEVLKTIKKDTPLIIEIKPEGRCIENVKGVVEIMKEYDGLYNIESFNPKVVKYLKDNEPQIIRGQLSESYFKYKEYNLFIKIVLTYLLSNVVTRPDYIAYDHNDANNISFRLISKLFKGECVAWTIKSPEQLNKAKKYYQQFIFDSFIPKK